MPRRLVAGPTPGPSPRTSTNISFVERGERFAIAFDRGLRFLEGFLRLPWRGLSGAPAPGRIVKVRSLSFEGGIHFIPDGC